MVPAISVSSGVVAVGHPNKKWTRTIAVRQTIAKDLVIRPMLDTTNAVGQWVPVHLPWIHIVPASPRLAKGQWVPVTITGSPPPQRLTHALSLALVLNPASSRHGLHVMSAPAVRVLLGTDPGHDQAHLTVRMPWIVWGSGVIHASTTVTDTGHTWYAPVMHVAVNGHATVPTRLPMLLVGMQARPTAAITVPSIGVTTVVFSATGAPPVTRHIVSLPGLPLAVALGAGALVEIVNLAVSKKIKDKKGEIIHDQKDSRA